MFRKSQLPVKCWPIKSRVLIVYYLYLPCKKEVYQFLFLQITVLGLNQQETCFTYNICIALRHHYLTMSNIREARKELCV